MPLTAIPVPDIPSIEPGDDLGAVIIAACRRANLTLQDCDLLAIAQKVVSKSENRYITLDTVTPSARAQELADTVEKDPRLVELILSEAEEVLAFKPGALIVAHRLGHVLANAGIDASNLPPQPDGRERVLLLPKDPNASCRALRAQFEQHFAARIGVLITDSVGRAWRKGSVGLALGAAGPPALLDKVGESDLYDRPLRVTTIGFADQIAAAASLVMGEAAEGLPVAIVRGLDWSDVNTDANELLRAKEEDLFR